MKDRSKVLGVGITHPDRLVIPESGVTKEALARHFAAMGEHMGPHVFGRPVALVRCVRGVPAGCFFQKHLDESIDGIEGADVARRGAKPEIEPVVRTTRGLVELAQRSVVELHLWGAHADDLERPDRVVFDLDPAPGVPWLRVVEAAEHVRVLLHELELEGFVLASGGKGLHVVVPLAPRHEWSVVKPFTQAIALALVRAAPERYVAKASKSARAGKIFVDWLRNGRGATAIAPFSPRAKPGAPVATPVDWSELRKIRADSFTVETIGKRLASPRRDPWRDYFKTRQTLRAKVIQELKLGAGA
jgi:bifunctional non-homologous end joining protein LigD